MPYPNQHAARVRDPGDFVEGSIRTATLSPGVTLLSGHLKGETTMTKQAYRFDKAKFTVAQAKTWLEECKVKVILFEPATETHRAFCLQCGSTIELKHGKAEDYECAKCGAEMAVLSAEHKAVRNVNVFRAGMWKGFRYTVQHLEEMIRNFNDRIIRPYLQITDDGTHRGARPVLASLAFGWVEKLWRDGERLYADFKQVPETIAKLIVKGALKQSSIEVYPNFRTTDGKEHGAALEAVLMFGTGLPAVYDLEDAAELFTAVETENEKHNIVLDEMTSHDPGDGRTGDIHNSPDPSGGRSHQPVRRDSKSTKEKAKVEIDAKEYQALVADQAVLKVMTDEAGKRKAEVQKLTASLSEAEGNVKTLTRERDEAVKAVGESKKATVETFVSTVVKDGKLEPARKDFAIAELCSLTDEQATDYRKRLEGLPSLFKTDAVETGDTEKKTGEPDKLDTEARDSAIKAAMKADKDLTYMAADEKLFGGSGRRLV